MQFSGLNDKEVLESREKYGSNVIPDSEPTKLADQISAFGYWGALVIVILYLIYFIYRGNTGYVEAASIKHGFSAWLSIGWSNIDSR